MAEQKEQIIIDVQIDTSKVAKDLSQAISKVASLKESQKELRKEIEAGNDKTGELAATYAEYGKRLETAQREIKSSTAALQLASSEGLKQNATLDEQRQYLNTLQKAYAQLTDEQKKNADGQDVLAEQIKALSDSVKEQEAAIGDTRRNVGNYAEGVTQAFGEMAHAGELMSPAIGLLRGMGGEGQKAAAVLDSLAKTMQLAGKASQVFSKATQSQQVATEGAAVAQGSLNAVMAANPVGAVVAAVSVLLPLVQSIADAFGDASKETAAFNAQFETLNRLTDQAKSDADFAAKVAAIYGASAAEQIDIRRDAAIKALEDATAAVDENLRIQREGSRKEKKAAKEIYSDLLKLQQDAQKEVNRLNNEATLQHLKDQKKQSDDARAAAAEREKIRQKESEEAAEMSAKVDAWLTEQMQNRTANVVQELKDRYAKVKATNDALLATMEEDEENEEEPLTVEDMVRKQYGLDEDGVAYYKQLIDKGLSHQEAALAAQGEQWKRHAKSTIALMGSIGGALSNVGDLIGEIGGNSKKAQRAQRAFAMTSIITNQAASIASGALAIMEGVESAVKIGFPQNIPAIAAITAVIGGMIASVTSTIAQAKQVMTQDKDGGNYATGGIVGGNSYSGDNMVAHVNSGEMILNKDQQARLFDALDGGEQGAFGIDYNMLAVAMSNTPAPVVVYKEMRDFEDKVATFNEFAKI